MSKVKFRPRSPPARGLRGDCFALRDLCEPRQHCGGIALQDLRARILADPCFRKRLAGLLAAEFGSVGAAHDALGAVQAYRRLDSAWAERVAIHVHLRSVIGVRLLRLDYLSCDLCRFSTLERS